VTVKKQLGKDVEAFRQIHDKNFKIPRKIKAALAELGDAWEYEAEFIKRCAVSNTDFAMFREDFVEHWLEAKSDNRNAKRVWCGTVKMANKLREYTS
jgi:hypothetical protein